MSSVGQHIFLGFRFPLPDVFVAVASKELRVSGGLETVVELLVSTASKQLQQAALYTPSCAVEENGNKICNV